MPCLMRLMQPVITKQYNISIALQEHQNKIQRDVSRLRMLPAIKLFATNERVKRSILFCLDEFASFGRLEMMDALRKLRKKHIRIMVLTQSMADIDLIYGHDERMAMLNNFRFKVVLGADDTDTQEYFVKLIGQKDVKKHSTSSN